MSPTPSQAITLDGVTKTFPGATAPAVDSLDLEITPGELVVLLGPSGCGKTTTLRMINRLEEPTSGRITVNGVDIGAKPVAELRRGIGYVIQDVGLFPHKSIADNIGIVPRLLGWSGADIDARVSELGELLELDSTLLRRYPAELSGGQQQRGKQQGGGQGKHQSAQNLQIILDPSSGRPGRQLAAILPQAGGVSPCATARSGHLPRPAHVRRCRRSTATS